jgi:hypothetical protein
MTTEKMTAGGICRKLSEAQAILTLLANDLGMEIEAGNDHIGLGIYHRALQSAQDLISPCLDSLDKLHRIDKTDTPKPAIADYVEALDKKAWTVQRRLYSLEANLTCIQEALHHTPNSIDPTDALGTAIAETVTLSEIQEKLVEGIKKLAD